MKHCTIRETNRNWASKVFGRIKRFDRTLKIGFPRGTSASVLRKAYANEYGTDGSGIRSSDLSERIPARPFLAMSVPRIAHEASAVLSTKGDDGLDESLDTIGKEAVETVAETINTGSFFPNSDYTKSKKNGDKPLVDTGEMARAISYEIED